MHLSWYPDSVALWRLRRAYGWWGKHVSQGCQGKWWLGPIQWAMLLALQSRRSNKFPVSCSIMLLWSQISWPLYKSRMILYDFVCSLHKSKMCLIFGFTSFITWLLCCGAHAGPTSKGASTLWVILIIWMDNDARRYLSTTHMHLIEYYI